MRLAISVGNNVVNLNSIGRCAQEAAKSVALSCELALCLPIPNVRGSLSSPPEMRFISRSNCSKVLTSALPGACQLFIGSLGGELSITDRAFLRYLALSAPPAELVAPTRAKPYALHRLRHVEQLSAAIARLFSTVFRPVRWQAGSTLCPFMDVSILPLNPAYIEIANERARKYYPLLVSA